MAQSGSQAPASTEESPEGPGEGPSETVLAPAIGGLVGNAFTQLTRVQGRNTPCRGTTSHTKAAQAQPAWNRGRHIIVPPLRSGAVMPTLPGHSRWLMEQRG